MPTIILTSPKGGCGKSTAAVVLATTLSRHGASVAIIDCDPNATVAAWKTGPTQTRVEVIAHTEPTTIARTIKSAATRQQFVICDLAGDSSLLVASATLMADLVIIPTRGSATDAAMARRAIAFIDDQGASSIGARPYRILFNSTKPGFATRDETIVRKTMMSAGVPIFKTDLAERAAYRSMFTFRLALEELDPSAVNGLDKAIENADAFAAEVTDSLRATRAAA